MPSSSSRAATRSTTDCVSETTSETLTPGMRALELAEEQRHDDRAPGPVDAPISELAGELALALAGELVEQLLLEREDALRAAIEAQSRLGRLHAAARAVEQLRAEPLLERAYLQRHRGLRDAEPLGRLREAAPLDDGAERCQLTRVHKQILSIQCLSTAHDRARPRPAVKSVMP